MTSADTARTLPTAPAIPTQPGSHGVWFDFNAGCRVRLPRGTWRVRITDLDTDELLLDGEFGAGVVASPRLYYQRYGIEISRSTEIIFRHAYSAAGRHVLISIAGAVLGDTIGWLPYAIRFQEKHGCHLTCAMAESLIPLFRDAYPTVDFQPHDAVRPERYYASYSLGVSFAENASRLLPCDFRLVGNHRAMGYALGVDPAEARPAIALPVDRRPIAEPYACIAVQSTMQCKYWNRPGAWSEIVEDLKRNGYRVVCIDRERAYGLDGPLNRIPDGAEDLTGDHPLVERAQWLKHADLFVGLSSGLSWLAWAVGTPVVLISGFTHPISEFHTPYRVINYNTCNSCWNDPRLRFDRHDFMWCPRHAGTPRQFECSTHISPAQVKAVVRTIPGFGTAGRGSAAGSG
jgi:autotransporter strand-loop-strand O-heptosyltransferase